MGLREVERERIVAELLETTSLLEDEAHFFAGLILGEHDGCTRYVNAGDVAEVKSSRRRRTRQRAPA